MARVLVLVLALVLVLVLAPPGFPRGAVAIHLVICDPRSCFSDKIYPNPRLYIIHRAPGGQNIGRFASQIGVEAACATASQLLRLKVTTDNNIQKFLPIISKTLRNEKSKTESRDSQ